MEMEMVMDSGAVVAVVVASEAAQAAVTREAARVGSRGWPWRWRR